MCEHCAKELGFEKDRFIAVSHSDTHYQNGFDKIKRLVQEQPMSVTKQYRVLFFPEYNSREYFKTVGKIWLWVLALIIASYLFLLGKTFILSYPIAKEKELALSNSSTPGKSYMK